MGENIQAAIDNTRIIQVAMGSPIMHLKQIIPYLEHREQVAHKHYYSHNDLEKEACLDMIIRINKEISLILGL
jgi:uncharacterized protein YkwD